MTKLLEGKHLVCLLLSTSFFVALYVYVEKRSKIRKIEEKTNENVDGNLNQSVKLRNDILRSRYEKMSTENLDKFQYIGPKKLKAKVFSAYYDDRTDALGNLATRF